MSTNNLCRICLEQDKNGEFADIFSTTRLVYNRNVTLNVLVKECSAVIIDKGDAYPKLICIPCLKNLNVAYKFKELCIQTDNKLRHKERELQKAAAAAVAATAVAQKQQLLEQNKKKIEQIHINDSAQHTEKLCVGLDKESRISKISVKAEDVLSEDDKNVMCSSDDTVSEKSVEIAVGRETRSSKKVAKEPPPPVVFKCNYCEKEFKSSEKQFRHERVHTRRRIVCEICGKGFGHETNFEIHMRTHTGDRPFTCGVCGVSKSTEGDLKSHMKIHSDECKYSCYICGKQFKWLSNQLRHMRWHKGERTHKCHICGKLFFEASDVKKHMYTHTGEKPYECQICSKAFRRKGQLRIHFKVMHHPAPVNN